MDNYEINGDTLAIISIDEKTSKIIESDKEFIINKNSLKIIDNSCRFFGSSYQGRFEGTKALLNISYKNPIIIGEYKEIIFFPTCSPRLDSCNWISLNNIKKYSKADYKTIVYFNNNKELIINMSPTSFENQYYRANLLLVTLKNKKTG